MARKKGLEDTVDLYAQAFPTNLRMLIEESGETQDEIALIITQGDGSHPNRTTISAYLSGRTHPDYEIIKQLASHFGVTIDWLVGMPGAVSKPDADLQACCAYLGLSETVVSKIKELAQPRMSRIGLDLSNSKIFEHLFSNEYIDSFFEALSIANGHCQFAKLKDDELCIPPNQFFKEYIPCGFLFSQLSEIETKYAFEKFANEIYKSFKKGRINND